MFGTRKLGKTSAQRRAMLRQQVTDLLENGATVATSPAISHIPTRSGQIVHMKFGFLNAPGGEVIELIQDVDENAHM